MRDQGEGRDRITAIEGGLRVIGCRVTGFNVIGFSVVGGVGGGAKHGSLGAQQAGEMLEEGGEHLFCAR